MGPQNSDPNNPNPLSQPQPVQADLSSSISPAMPVPNGQQAPIIPPMVENQPLPISPTSEPTLASEPTPTPLPEPESPSVLDNPLGVPAEVPPIDGTPAGGFTPTGGFSWSPPTEPGSPPSPEPFQLGQIGSVPEAPPQPIETAPTDLSQLTGGSEPQSIYTPPVSQPETLIVPPTAEPTTLQADGGSGGIPKWLWIVGGVLLLVVIGASSYFILGIGKAPEQPNPPVQPQQTLITPPSPSPIVTQPPSASDSAGFNSAGGQTTATSAADLIKQRQQGN